LSQIAKMNMAGMSHLNIVKSINAAWGAAATVPTSTVSSNLAAIGHMRMVFGNIADPIKFLPETQKAQAVLQFMTGRRADESYELSKALEMRGATKNVPQFNTQMNAMIKAIISSSGKVTPSDFLMTFKYGRSATLGWSDEFTYQLLPTLIQELKSKGGTGRSAGTAMMSAFQGIVGGVISQKSLSTWHRLGLLDPSKEIFNKVGSLKGIEPGGITGSSEFIRNPFAWVQTVLKPALINAGFTTMAQQREILPYLFGNRTAQFAMGQMLLQSWKFTRDQRLIQQSQGLNAAYGTQLNVPGVQWTAFKNQFTNFLTELGKDILPFLTRQLSAINDMMKSINANMPKYQHNIKIFIVAFATIGAVLLAVVSPITAFVALIVGMGLAFANLWDKSKALWKVIGSNPARPDDASAAHNSHFGFSPIKTHAESGGFFGGHIFMDGHKVGKIVSKNQSHAATMHTNSLSHFDTSMGLQNTNMNFVGGF
jgi:hypothetical protein